MQSAWGNLCARRGQGPAAGVPAEGWGKFGEVCSHLSWGKPKSLHRIVTPRQQNCQHVPEVPQQRASRPVRLPGVGAAGIRGCWEP